MPLKFNKKPSRNFSLKIEQGKERKTKYNTAVNHLGFLWDFVWIMNE